jgi:hypothetical protein
MSLVENPYELGQKLGLYGHFVGTMLVVFGALRWLGLLQVKPLYEYSVGDLMLQLVAMLILLYPAWVVVHIALAILAKTLKYVKSRY